MLKRVARCGLFFVLATIAAAQPPHAGQLLQLPQGVVTLAGGWRTQSGDNPAWAAPGFDDSHWATAELGPSRGPISPGWRWYRKEITIPPGSGPLALLIVAPANAYQVYVNGQPLAGAVILPPSHIYKNRENVLHLPVASGSVEIAVRLYILREAQAYHVALTGAAIGGAQDIETAAALIHQQRLVTLIPSVAINGALAIGGLGALLLYLLRRESREYLWIGLYLVLGAASSLFYFAALAGTIPLSLNSFFGDPLVYFCIVAQIEFTYDFARRRVGRLMRAYEIVALASVLVGVLGLLPTPRYLQYEVIVNLPAAIVLPILLLVWFLRGNREAGWLILPSLLPSAATIYNDLTPSDLVLHLGGAPINPADLGDFLFLLAIGLVIALRFTRVSQQQARAAAELNAAREIQQRLVPLVLPELPGCQIEAAYLPATEVGGDFYQVFEQPGASSLIVVGDVSGKGLKAAMTGTLTIGALRTLAQQALSPAKILVRLNAQLPASSDGGFITCLCARIAPDGTLTLANAGHLPPYRNGEELPIDNGLPLGIAAEAAYSESTIQLAPGDQLTFLSDGVVEAQSPTGELFGFDRTQAISTHSAEVIASAAQQFGQEDDITVLTLQYAPAEVLHA